MLIIVRTLIISLFWFMSCSLYADPGKAMEAYQNGKFKLAYKEFKKAAIKGHADSQYNLAVMLYSGKGVPKDKAEAVYWFIQSAEGGDQSAQYNLGVLYSSDKELPNEYPKMENGEIYFEVRSGKSETNKAKAVKWYKMAAEKGHISAQLNLGVIFNQGIGVKKDYKEAAKWYQKAADQGNSKAQLNLGILYDLGRGVTKDAVKAEDNYKKAAMKGIRDAQYNLGIIYYNGDSGVKQNYIESYAWLALAKEQGSELAAIYKDKVERKISGSEKKKAKKLAIAYYRKYLKPFMQ